MHAHTHAHRHRHTHTQMCIDEDEVNREKDMAEYKAVLPRHITLLTVHTALLYEQSRSAWDVAANNSRS